MNIANKGSWVLVCILGLGIVFLGLDKCGSSRKVDELRGQYEEASRIANVERLIKEEIIKEQKKGIEEKDAEIKELSGIVIKTNKNLTEVKGELGELEKDFASLEECQVQYDKLIIAFNFTMSIIDKLGMPIEYYNELGIKQVKFPKGSITFGLNEKYKRQVKISLAHKSMYESSANLLGIQTTRVKELEKINRRLKLTGKLKTGIVVAMAGVVLYSLLKD